MLQITILESGNLALSIPDADDRAELADMIADARGYWHIMSDLFEEFSCNGSYTHFDASHGNPYVGLSSAPCIVEALDTDDDGNHTIEGRFWYFDRYVTILETEELVEGREVIYTLYQD